MKKLQAERLTLHRETVLCLESLDSLKGGFAKEVGTDRQTSPLCVSTCCGGCDQ